MSAILRRELGAYFASPIGYIYLAVFNIFSGFFFFSTSLAPDYADMSGVYSSLITIVLFLIPILTMRLFSEDRKQRTDQALLTAPISLVGLVLGKFLAAVVVYAISLSVTILYGVVIASFAPLNWASVFGQLFALFLMGLAVIAIGMFLSSMTESQVVAAVGGFAVAMFLMLIDMLSPVFSDPAITRVLTSLSFYNRSARFAYGIFNFADLLFFLSVCFVFLFLTVRVFDKRRWA